MRRIRWLALEAICREFSVGTRSTFYIEDPDGRPVTYVPPIGKAAPAAFDLVAQSVNVGRLRVIGEPELALVRLCVAVCQRELEHQITVSDMAEATARLWRQTNALLRMAASTNLAMEPTSVLDSVLAVLEHSTNLQRGSGVVRLPGETAFTLFAGQRTTSVVPERLASMDEVEDDVRLLGDHETDAGVLADCARLLGYPRSRRVPVAIARLATEKDRYGFLLAPADSVEQVTSEDLKMLGAAAQILSIAVENSHTLRRERAATRLEVENELLNAQARDMEEMLHVVAHDLRSPMTAMYGFMHIALEHAGEVRDTLRASRQGELAERAQSMFDPLESSIHSVEKLNRMVQRLLDFSRVARMDYHLEDIDLRQVVEGVLKSLSYQIAEKEIDVEVGRLPVVNGDRIHLEAVFGNLIDNAIKYMGDRTPRAILIGCRGGDDPAGPIYCVEDTGVGMSSDQTAKAFLPFQRFRSDAAPGEGIGLPYVRKIVERHGGRIWCESAEGVGTKFFFTLGSPTSERP